MRFRKPHCHSCRLQRPSLARVVTKHYGVVGSDKWQAASFEHDQVCRMTSTASDIFWLGVHKTGTTFLQKSLALSRAPLEANRIGYIELEPFRKLYTRPLLYPDHPELPGPMGYTTEWLNGADPGSTQEPWRRLVFDENILSLVQNALSPTGLYPNAAPRARRIADHLQLVRPTLVLGLRNFADFLPSLYCEALKSTPFKRFRTFQTVPFQALSWSSLIDRLKAAFPGSEILIYCSETLQGNERALLEAVTGIEADAFTLLQGRERAGFSHDAVKAMHSLQKERKVQRQDVAALVQQYPREAGVPGFRPWSEKEGQQLARIYTEDLARIGSRTDLKLLAPDRPSQSDPAPSI